MSEKPFYGAECPSYPNCNGGCGLGCTHEIENTLSKYLYTGEPGQHEAIKAAASELAKSVAAQSAVLTHGPIQRRSLHLIQQLAWYYDVNDCLDRPNGAALKVPVVDLCEAKRIALALGLPTGPGYGGAAQAPGNGAVEAESSIDFHQLRGRSHDIIQEAITTYDEWMLDDDYEATPVLRKIIERMRERIAPTLPATQGDGE